MLWTIALVLLAFVVGFWAGGASLRGTLRRDGYEVVYNMQARIGAGRVTVKRIRLLPLAEDRTADRIVLLEENHPARAA